MTGMGALRAGETRTQNRRRAEAAHLTTKQTCADELLELYTRTATGRTHASPSVGPVSLSQ